MSTLSAVHCVPRKPDSFHVAAGLQIQLMKKVNSLHPGNRKQLGRRNKPYETVYSLLNGNRLGRGIMDLIMDSGGRATMVSCEIVINFRVLQNVGNFLAGTVY